ncbi:MAG: biopolymer transporter ExbD [Bacteroidetes bacterium]|nr:biopolymer transporter ExbD [Bacteroidota bacterium]
MAEIIQEEKGKKGGKRRPKKHSTRIDMTPMVDLMCLLITFFMLTTAFSKPKVMVITMPEKNKEKDKDIEAPKIPKERTLNILLTESHKVYYYNGLADPKTPPLPALVKTDFSKDGIRKVLLGRNKDLFTRIVDFHDSITGEKVKIFLYIDDSLKPVFAKAGNRMYKSSDKGASWTSVPGPQITDDDVAVANLLNQSPKTDLTVPMNGRKKHLNKREASISEINPIVDAETKSRKRDDMKPHGTGPFVLIKADDKVKYRDIVNIIDEMAICNIAGYAVVEISPIELEMLKNAPK